VSSRLEQTESLHNAYVKKLKHAIRVKTKEIQFLKHGLPSSAISDERNPVKKPENDYLV
jgi:hypothetical protein